MGRSCCPAESWLRIRRSSWPASDQPNPVAEDAPASRTRLPDDSCSISTARCPRMLAGLGNKDAVRELGLYVSVSLVAVLCYVNSLQGDFVHDDIVAITRNPDVLGKTTLRQLFTNDFWGKPMVDPTSHKSYRPLTTLTFRLNHMFAGHLRPRDFHAVNVILHAIVVQLLTFIGRESLSWDREDSATAALLFATHPIHTEAVASIVGRAELLCSIFFFLSFIAYFRYTKETNCTSLLDSKLSTCVILAGIALLSKEQGITVLVVCSVYHFVIVLDKQERRKIIHEIWSESNCRCHPIMFLTIAFLVLIGFRFWILQGSMPLFSEQDNPASFLPSIIMRYLTYSYLIAFHAWLMIAPITLSYDWQMGSISPVTTIWDYRVVSTALVIITIFLLLRSLLLTTKANSRLSICVALCFLLIPFIPASNLFVTVGFVVAERVLYIPSAGLALLLVIGIQRLKQQVGQNFVPLFRGCLLILVALFFVKTFTRNTVWLSREALFHSGLESVPSNSKVHYNYANLQRDLGKTSVAIKHYRIAIRLWPHYASAHNNIATLLPIPEKAEWHYKMAIAANPNHPKAHFNLATLVSKQGNTKLAIRLLKRSIELDPTFAAPYSTLASLYSDKGYHNKAENCYLQALKLEPENADFINNYGAFLQHTGRIREAVIQYQRALSIEPNHSKALVNAAKSLQILGHANEAEMLYKRALSVQEDPQILDNLGVLYINGERMEEAQDVYELLLERYPEYHEGKIHFAQLLSRLRNFHRAEELLKSVIKSNSTQREALHQLAVLYNLANRTSEALDHIVKAVSQCKSSDKSCAEIHVHHGDILKDIFDYDGAAQSYILAIRLDSRLPRAYTNLAVIRHMQGNYFEALQLYKAAHALEPSNPIVLENVAKLRQKVFRTRNMVSRKSKSCCVAR